MKNFIKAVQGFSDVVLQASESMKGFANVLQSVNQKKLRHFNRYQRMTGQK